MKQNNIEDLYKLTPMQQGMLFHSQFDTESDLYYRQLSCSMHGELEHAAFAEAWREGIARHTILRTSFQWKNLETPVQVVHRRVELPLEIHDWREFDADERAARLEEFFRVEQAKKFDLTQAPLMRLVLIQMTDLDHQFVLSNHHLLLDGWSRFFLLKEVFTIYEAICRNAAPQLERPHPYREYITWMRQQDMSQAETFWRKLLKGFTTPTPFVVDREVDAATAHAPERGELRTRLSAETSAELQAFTARHQLTLNTLIQGAWAALLHRYSGEEDLVFGSVVSGRPASLPGIESIVGMFINTLPVRVRVSPADIVLSWLKELQLQQAEAREFEFSPLVEVHGWSDVPRTQPLFESLLVVDNYPADTSMRRQTGKLAIGNLRGVESNNYPIALTVIPDAELELRMPFDCRRFEPETITRMLGHLQVVLKALIANPDGRLGSLPLLTAPEQQQLLHEWNRPSSSIAAASYPSSCLHSLFESQVEQTPEAVAVKLGDEQLTYRELNLKANQLAHHLRGLGVGAEVPVAVFVERSLNSIISLLAILKAGGVYLPLDTAYPSDRIEFILEDADAPVILTEDDCFPSLPIFAAASEIVCLDSDWDAVALSDEENPDAGVTPDNLAYIIYTSGSTGQPKGVCLTHAAIVSHCSAVQVEFGVRSDDRVLEFASFSFDVSLEQIFSALLSGATLTLRGTELWSLAEFDERLRQDELTVINPPTAYWHRWIQEIGGGRLEAATGQLKLVIAGGDVMSPQAVELWRQSPLGHVRLLNAYGPTEAAITSLLFEVPAASEKDEARARIPIGRPLAGREIYILDRQGQCVPVGVPGELHIGGRLLARNYLNSPELTAEKFIPDPFASEPGARLYRTGDRARFLPDGNVEFLGRVDNQIKIRGFRIEPGEIEAALNQHPAISEAVVNTWIDPQGEKRLAAYLVGSGDAVPAASELRSFLEQKLPEHFIPAAFVALEELPLTPNGKVDRRALPSPEIETSVTDSSASLPLTQTQELLLGVWSELLGGAQLGLHDDFFESGGHSLLATQMVSRVREVFQQELSLRTIFERPTIYQLAASLEAAALVECGLDAAPILPVSRTEDLPLSFAQQRLWFVEQLEPGTAAHNRPYAMRLRGKLDVDALQKSFNDIVARHEVLRTTFANGASGPVQIIAPDFRLQLPVTNLRHVLSESEREERVNQLAKEEAVRPFDLASGPLLRASLLQLGEEEYVLLLTMHHIVTDGWSEGIMIRELTAFYESHTTGRPAALPELPVQYADFAKWQRATLDGELLDKHLSYWKRQLADLPDLQLNYDFPRPPHQTSRGATHSHAFPANVSGALRELSRREGGTLFMTLLAAFQTLLYRYTGQEDIVIGTGIANRNRSETENLIGFFVNQLVLRTDLSGDPTFRELLARVREVTLGAYAHQDLPFEKLVEALHPERDLSRTPLFQTVMVMQNASQSVLELPGLSFSPLRVVKETSHFDLILSMADTEQGLVASIEYNTDLFEPSTIARMLSHFESLLESIVANPDERLLEIALDLTGETGVAAETVAVQQSLEAEQFVF